MSLIRRDIEKIYQQSPLQDYIFPIRGVQKEQDDYDWETKSVDLSGYLTQSTYNKPKYQQRPKINKSFDTQKKIAMYRKYNGQLNDTIRINLKDKNRSK